MWNKITVMSSSRSHVLLFVCLFVYGRSGLELTFYSGVYGTCIGAMTRFGKDAKSLIGISGICIGIGEILGESRRRCRFHSCHMSAPLHKRDQGRDLSRVTSRWLPSPSCLCRVFPGGGVFGMLNKCNRFGRNPVVLLGLITHFVAFYLIFLNIASDAPLAPEAGTDLQAYINPR